MEAGEIRVDMGKFECTRADSPELKLIQDCIISNVLIRLFNWLTLLFAGVGLAVSGVLSASHALKVDPPCGIGGSGCATVANHPSSQWFGVPVAYFGVAAYVVLILISIMRLSAHGAQFRKLAIAGFGFTALGTVISMALQYIAINEIKATCLWCMTSAIAMALCFLCHAVMLQSEAPTAEQASSKKINFGLIALVVVGSAFSIGMETSKMMTGAPRKVIKAGIFEGVSVKEKLVKDGHSKGAEDAPVVIVEFADLYCGACRASYNHMERIVADNPGKVKWVFRHFPLISTPGHENSLTAAMVAEHAGKQGKFFEYLKAIFENAVENTNSETKILQLLDSVGADSSEAKLAIESEETFEFKRVYEDLKTANKLGIQITPTFIVFVNNDEPVAVDRPGLDTLMREPKVRAALGR